MKPILLKIKGLNCFEEEEIINFEKLIRNGLFGIFGPTGSGKSTIIDAITISLYGEIARFKGDKKVRNFININCDTAYVYFKFSICKDNKYTQYVIERSYKRTKDGQKLIFARLYFYDKNKVEVVADNATTVNNIVKEILGLSYDDFLKTVILPQGKFSDFLLLVNKERRDMLERIFCLENYGEILVSKVKEILNITKNNLDILESKLEIYKDIKEDIIEENINKLNFINKELDKLILKEEEVNLELDNYKNYENLYIELQEYEKKIKILLEDENNIYDKKNILDNIKKIKILKPLYLELTDITKNIEINRNKIKDINISYEKLNIIEKEYKLNFENAKIRKENNYPNLIKKEAEIKNIITIIKEVEVINEELNQLRQKYKKFKYDFDIYKTKIENIEKEKTNLEKNILSIEERKIKLEVDVCFRNYIEKGLQIQNNIKQNEEELKNILNKIDKMKEDINLLHGKKTVLDKNYKLIEKNIKENEIKLLNLLKVQIITEDEYNEAKEKIYDIEKIYNLKIEDEENLKKLKDKDKSIEKDYKNIEKDYKKRLNTILQLEEDLNVLSEKIKIYNKNKIINELIENLKDETPCPVCGSVKHYSKNLKIDLENNNYTEKVEKLKNKIKDLKLLNAEEKIKLEYKYNEIKYIKNNILNLEEKINICDIDKNTIKNIKIKLEKDIRQKKDTLENIEIIKQKIDKLKNNKLYIYNDMTIKEEIIKNNKEIINFLNIDKEKIEARIEKLKEQLKKILLNINLNVKDFNILDKEIKAKDLENAKLEKEYISLKNVLNDKNKLLKESKEYYYNLKSKLDEVDIVGREKKEILLKYNKNIKNIYEGDNIKNFLKEIQDEIKYIEKDEIKTRDLYNKANSKIINILEEKKYIESQNILLEEMHMKKINEFKLYLKENNLKEDNFEIYLDKDEIKIEKEIKEFESRKINLLSNFKMITEKLENIHIKDNIKKEEIKNKIREIEKLKNNIQETILSLRENKIILQENIKKYKVDFEKVTKLKKEELLLNDKLDLLSDLYKLFECKKFVEYIAKKQLNYLVIDASNKLKNMTRGRYALELDDVEFIIRDDFNGGSRRTPKTLSGGETFITSLCLALALSTKIQLKNKSPIELFFLDEGFGTLDGELLDIVIENLTNLQTQNMNIGIISHVEELKNRMARKLIISNNTLKNKKVFIE